MNKKCTCYTLTNEAIRLYNFCLPNLIDIFGERIPNMVQPPDRGMEAH